MTKLGLQTFTVRRLMQNENDLDQTLQRLSDMGIKNLELAYIPWSELYIDTLREYLKKYDMKAISSQIKLSVIEKNLDFLIQVHKSLGMKYMAVSVIPFRHLLSGPWGLKRLAWKLNSLGKTLHDEGIQLMFHHHNYEFIKFGSKMAFDILVEHFNPNYVQILSDTYWIRRGKFNVIDFLRKYKSHIKAVHLRGCINKNDTNLYDGDVDFCKVLDYIKKNKFYYGVIEQNTSNEFEEIEKSIEVIKECNHQL